MTRVRSVIGLLAAAATLAACTSTSGGGDGAAGGPPGTSYETGMIGADEAAGEPVQGGTVTYAAYSEPRVLDPADAIVAGATGGIALAGIYDVLMRWDSERNEVVPQLAESLEANEDSTTWTLKLREGVTFSDGTPLDAAAVQWSLQRYVEEGGAEAALWSRNVTAVQTPDPRTVVVDLATSWPSFDYLLTTGPGMIVARSAVAGDSFAPVGAGPFTFASHRPQEELVLEANENYWDGRPNIDTFRAIFLSDQQAVQDSLNSGSVNMAMLRDPDVVDERLTAGSSGFLNMVALGSVAAINASEGRPGSDPRVRKAMQMAIDPNVIQERTFDGAGVASSAIFPEYSRWHTDVAPLPHDPDQARALLDQAKAEGYDGKIVYSDGQDPASRQAALAVKASLEAVGFTVELDLLRSVADQTRKAQADQDYDVIGWGISWREAGPFARMFTTLHSEGNSTVGMATSPEMDALFAEFQTAASEQQQHEIMGRIQQQWNELVPALVYGPIPELVTWSDTVHGIEGSSNSLVLLDDAWVAAPAG